jgi:hypothetical protein
MKEKKVKHGYAWGLLLIGTVVCIVQIAPGASLNAAEPKATVTSVSGRPVTILDPFTFSVLTISGGQAIEKPTGVAASSGVTFVRPPGRLLVRVPPRLPMRSPFRPNW